MVEEAKIKAFLRKHRSFGNLLRNAPLIKSLRVIHDYIVFFQFATPLPPDVQTIEGFGSKPQFETHLFEWELDILCRELFLHASAMGTLDIRKWNDLAQAIDRIKDLHDESLKVYPEILDDRIMAQLLRYQNLEFPWQRKLSSRWLVRYLKVFGTSELNEMIEKKVGLPIETILRIGLALAFNFTMKSAIALPMPVDEKFIKGEDVTKFVAYFGASLFKICQDAAETFSLGEDFIYTRNPLLVHPLIVFTADGHEPKLLCPIPNYLIRRIAEGLYYEICTMRNFGDHFGPAFQSYIGEAMEATDRAKAFQIIPEASYYVGKQRKDTIDWIVSDKSGHLFIECKTKRLTFGSKTKVIERAALDADIRELGKAVAQTYKALRAALDNEHPNWKQDGNPIYPLVVMLEDYYGVGLYSLIKAEAVSNLQKAGIDSSIVDAHPFVMASTWDLELSALVMAEIGINAYMANKVTGEIAEWDLEAYTMNFFKDKLKGLDGNLFPKEMDRIAPGLSAATQKKAN